MKPTGGQESHKKMSRTQGYTAQCRSKQLRNNSKEGLDRVRILQKESKMLQTVRIKEIGLVICFEVSLFINSLFGFLKYFDSLSSTASQHQQHLKASRPRSRPPRPLASDVPNPRLPKQSGSLDRTGPSRCTRT